MDQPNLKVKNIPMQPELHGRVKEFCGPKGLKIYVFVADVITKYLDGDLLDISERRIRGTHDAQPTP